MTNFKFGESFAGEESSAVGLELDDPSGDALIAFVFQARQHSRTEKYLQLIHVTLFTVLSNRLNKFVIIRTRSRHCVKLALVADCCNNR